MLMVLGLVGRSGNGGGVAKDDELSHPWPTVSRIVLGLALLMNTDEGV